MNEHQLQTIRQKLYEIISYKPPSEPGERMLQQMGISMTKAVQRDGVFNVFQFQSSVTHHIITMVVDVLKELDNISVTPLALPCPEPEPARLPIDVAMEELVDRKLPVRAARKYLTRKYVRAVFNRYNGDAGSVMRHLGCNRSSVSYYEQYYMMD